MPTRLEVLLQRRKSAAAELLHRHIKANASAGIKPAAREWGIRLGRWEFSGIIQPSYINSLTISREPAGLSTAKRGFLGMGSRNPPRRRAVCAARWEKLCRRPLKSRLVLMGK